MKFEYDQKGEFYYFLLPCMTLVLIPVTFCCWPNNQRKETVTGHDDRCQCPQCIKKDKQQTNWNIAVRVVLVLAWVTCIRVAYQTSQVQIDWTEFDPYIELNIDKVATVTEIKKAYRSLSQVYHPDIKDTGDPNRFMRISKAYQTLTNKEAMKNWKKYGNPDGPSVMQIGFAIPKWLVEKQNYVLVLGSYLLLFLVILPIVVYKVFGGLQVNGQAALEERRQIQLQRWAAGID